MMSGNDSTNTGKSSIVWRNLKMSCGDKAPVLTIDIAGETLALSSLSPMLAVLASPASKDYAATRCGVTEIYGPYSHSEWKAISPIRKGQTEVPLAGYAGHDYYRDCLKERK